MSGEERKQPELRTRQAHRPRPARPGGRRDAFVQLPHILDQRAHVGTDLEHPLGLGEDRARGAGLGERKMSADELEPHLDGQPGKTVIQKRPQAVRACQRRARILRSRLVERDARCRHVRERACRVVAEVPLLDERLRRPRPLPCLAPGSVVGGEERELCLREDDHFGGAAGLPRLDGRGEVIRSAVGCAEQRMRDSAQEQRARPPPAVRGELIDSQIAVGDRSLDTVGHHSRPQRGHPGLDRRASIRERDRRGCPLGESEPPLCLCRAAC